MEATDTSGWSNCHNKREREILCESVEPKAFQTMTESVEVAITANVCTTISGKDHVSVT